MLPPRSCETIRGRGEKRGGRARVSVIRPEGLAGAVISHESMNILALAKCFLGDTVVIDSPQGWAVAQGFWLAGQTALQGETHRICSVSSSSILALGPASKAVKRNHLGIVNTLVTDITGQPGPAGHSESPSPMCGTFGMSRALSYHPLCCSQGPRFEMTQTLQAGSRNFGLCEVSVSSSWGSTQSTLSTGCIWRSSL